MAAGKPGDSCQIVFGTAQSQKIAGGQPAGQLTRLASNPWIKSVLNGSIFFVNCLFLVERFASVDFGEVSLLKN